jgi:Region in Clathrin and VPS
MLISFSHHDATPRIQVERRNRLRLLHPWLEARVAQGNTEPALHNAIGKIYITLNREPLQFLQNNQFYEPAVIGAFCEKLDPHLAFEAYKSARGTYLRVHYRVAFLTSVLFSLMSSCGLLYFLCSVLAPHPLSIPLNPLLCPLPESTILPLTLCPQLTSVLSFDPLCLQVSVTRP